MQNRYVGDIGDYLKLGILRALSPGFHLGIVWWLLPDESHNRDGRHISYLNRPDQWRHFDPDLFDTLRGIVSAGQRDVHALEAAGVLPGAIFASVLIPIGGPIAQRQQGRHEWLRSIRRRLEAADLLFPDPDNGLEPAGFHPMAAKSGKSIMISAVCELARPGRCLIVYHHQSRRNGGHHAEMAHWADRLRDRGRSARQIVFATPLLSAGCTAAYSTASRADRGGLAELHYVASWQEPFSVNGRPDQSDK